MPVLYCLLFWHITAKKKNKKKGKTKMSKTRTIIQVDSKDGESYEQLQLTARKVDLMGETQVFPKVRELYIGKDVTDVNLT